MLVNKVVICPICGKNTLFRIQAGYLKEYPVRIHCANCRALLKGVYICPKGPSLDGLHMVNAGVQDCEPNMATNRIPNTDYVAEISGELPCRIYINHDEIVIGDTPYMRAANRLKNVPELNNRLNLFVKQIDDWKRRKSTAFQLLDEGSTNYVATALDNKMGEFPYDCDSLLKSLQCLEEVVLEETKYLFVGSSQDDTVINLLSVLSKLDVEPLTAFVNQIGGADELIMLYRRTVEVFSSFMAIYPYILPAETFMRYKDKCSDNLGIATCSYTDIKTFYQDAYETLLSLYFIPVCLDNILLRGSYNVFNEVVFQGCFVKGNDDYKRYLNLDNGWKLERIQDYEPLQNIICLPASKDLRNGIGHNNVKYDAVSQIITAYDKKKKDKVVYQTHLLQMAVDCIGLAKSAVLLGEIILYILRRESPKIGEHSIIHPRFYKNVERNDKCPCGSNLKYKKCCLHDIEKLTFTIK